MQKILAKLWEAKQVSGFGRIDRMPLPIWSLHHCITFAENMLIRSD